MARLRTQRRAINPDNAVSEDPQSKPVPRSTEWARKHGRQTMQQKAEEQRYTTAEEDRILCLEATRMFDLGSKTIPAKLCKRAFELKCQRLSEQGLEKASQSIRPPNKNWPCGFLERHKEPLQIENIVGLGWRRKSPLWGDQVADFVASDADVNQLCPQCAEIRANFKRMLNKAQPNESRKIHVFKGILASVYVSSCKLCYFVLACSKSWGWPNAVKYSLEIHHMENIFGPTLCRNKLVLSLAIEDEHLKGVHRGWLVPVSMDDPSDVGGQAWGPLQHNVNFTVIQEWLDFCDTNHSESCGAGGYDDIPFFRLIDCTTHSIVDAPPNCRFAALSYCWGPPDPSSQHNVDGDGLPSNVPLMIKDALNASRKLGIPYLWVDRYCITQDDISPVKPIQLQNMHKVYRSAYITIIAACGHSPDFGLPGITLRARKAQLSINTHGYQLLCIPDILQEIQDCTWSTRGWTLQENYLSRRRLVFTETQTYFQCWHMHCCEAIPTCLIRAHTKDLKRFKIFNKTFRVFPLSGIGRTGAEIDKRINEYLFRSLTKESDALKAFLGIFQAFRELENPVIDVWGLPMSKVGGGRCGGVQHASNSSALDEMRASFLSSLAWSDSTCSLTSLRILFQRPDFPSWSWAAWRSLRTFSRKSIPTDTHSPRVSFRSLQDVAVGLEDYENFLGLNTSITLLQPCIVAYGWVTNVWFAEEFHGEGQDPLFAVQSPIPTRRVSLIMNAETLVHFRHQCLVVSFQVLLLGGDLCHLDGGVPLRGWKDVHAILLYRLPDGTYMRLGVVTWSLLGHPSVDEESGTMRVKELFKARRIVPQCQCGCQIVEEAIFEQYLEDDSHVMHWKKSEFVLV